MVNEMSRYIALNKVLSELGLDHKDYVYIDKHEVAERIKKKPSIDIVRCKECKWLRYCETEDLDLYLDCDKFDGGGIPRSENWFCADGEREGEL